MNSETRPPTVMHTHRFGPGVREEMFPGEQFLECGCCCEILPTGVITHMDEDIQGPACHHCGPELFDAELHLRATPGIRPPTMEDLNSMKEGW